MLISTNPTTDHIESHNSVVKDYECRTTGDDPDDSDPPKQICKEYENEADSDAPKIGYEPAWRCVLGTGDGSVSRRPSADAGPDQTVECQGGGGAIVALDGSGSRDVDCDVLSYAWAGPFGLAAGRKPSVFLPLGTSAVTLSVWDGWWSSSPDTTRLTVIDTQPPSLQLTLTPTLLWPADHSLIRVNAAVSAA